MASYRGHLAFSTTLGLAYGGLAFWQGHLDWAPAVLGAGVTAAGGLLPDLDSNSGVPVREMSGLAAVVGPCLMLRRLQEEGLSMDQVLVVLSGAYLFIRYVVAALFRRITVHRGMFHSIPAMLIAGLAVFLLNHHPNLDIRFYLAGGVMVGFLSHLVLDELCSVDFHGAQIRLARSAGSALKFWSSSWLATLVTYVLLGVLVWLASQELEAAGVTWRMLQERLWGLLTGGPQGS